MSNRPDTADARDLPSSTTPSRPTAWKRFRARRGSSLALWILAGVALLAASAPVLPLASPSAMDPARSSLGPSASWEALDTAVLEQLREDRPTATALRTTCFGERALFGALGTDVLGRDLLARLIWGGRVSLMVGLVATLVSVLIGVGWGAVSGFAGGRTDAVLMRVVDVLYSIPRLFLVILVVALLRERSMELREYGIDRLTILFVVIGAVSWLTMARVVRGQVLALRDREFVVASRALGNSGLRILLWHVMPNLWGLVAVYLTLTIPRVILFEAFLSFLGLGVEPPGVSWGILASEGLENLTAISIAWWLVVFPGVMLVLTLSALNTIGDALRDALDPRTMR